MNEFDRRNVLAALLTVLQHCQHNHDTVISTPARPCHTNNFNYAIYVHYIGAAYYGIFCHIHFVLGVVEPTNCKMLVDL